MSIGLSQLGLVFALVSPLSSVPSTEEPATEHSSAMGTDEAPRSIELAIDGAAEGFDTILTEALTQHRIRITEDLGDDTVEVTIRPWSGGSVEGYGYDLQLSRDGEGVGDGFSQVCVGCDVVALANEIAVHVADMAKTLPPPERPPEPTREVHISRPTVSPLEVEAPDAPRRSLSRPLLAVGIPTLVGGCTMLGVGGALLAKGEVRELAPGNDQYLKVTDYRPTGLALAISGGVALAVGAVLTGVGIHQRVRERRQQAWRDGPRWILRPPVARSARVR